jgi:hypothetical protein
MWLLMRSSRAPDPRNITVLYFPILPDTAYLSRHFIQTPGFLVAILAAVTFL